jgi:proteasome lid subunit RPN8/RPN11
MRLEISREVLAGIRADAATAHPLEACGLLFGSAGEISGWQMARNVAAQPETEFEIDPAALFAALRAERGGGPCMMGYWHSHPGGEARPSTRDVEGAQVDGKIWVIVAGDDIGAWRYREDEMYDWSNHDVVEKDGLCLAIPKPSGIIVKGFDHLPMATGEIRHLIPRAKSDEDLVPMIVEAGYPAIAPILDDLMKWTADPCWPVCIPLIGYLSTLGAPMVEPIRRVLRGTDGGHKYMCLDLLVRVLPLEDRVRLRDDLCRLAETTNDEDRLEEVDVLAREILAALTE